MKRLSILSFALMATTLTQQGAAWAQTDTKKDDWGQVKTVTSEWTHITAGSTKGFELKDDYYYVTEDLTFTNTNGGAGQGSGLYVQEGKTVHLHIPAGVTITAIGADADSTSGAGAGILLPKTSTLHITGEGKIVGMGGNAANGKNGGDGSPGEMDDESVGTWFLGKKILTGVGGAGGYGGGGAGAGIGTAGGKGGNGGAALALNDPDRPQSHQDWGGGDLAGLRGNNGGAGATAAEMGKLYIQSTITTKFTGGAKGNGAKGGKPGKVVFTGGEIEIKDIHMVAGIPIPEVDLKDLQTIAGGGGGAGGAGGGSAKDIGTGGAGGGGGAAGACGSACAKNAWLASDWGSVGAGGGKGGEGTDNNNGENGFKCWFQGDDSPFDDMTNHKDGGDGGKAGTASADKSSEIGATETPSYNVKFYSVGVTASKESEAFKFDSNTKITLPTLSGGSGKQSRYKWLLSIYGNVAGTTTGHCGGPNGDVYAPGDVVDLSNIYGDIEFCAVYVGCEIDCTSRISSKLNMAWNTWVTGKYTVVDLKNRTLYKDGNWNTLTLPFSLSAEKLATTSLAGADIRTFKSASWDAKKKELTINFSTENDGKIEAGVPCIIRWGEPGNAPGGTIENPTFSNVTLKMWDPEDFDDGDENNTYETESNGVRFQALIGPVLESANSRSLVLGGDNTLYRPANSLYVYSTHAYFTYTLDSRIAMTRSIVFNFGNGEKKTTNIDEGNKED